jgi:hypothetical protein
VGTEEIIKKAADFSKIYITFAALSQAAGMVPG